MEGVRDKFINLNIWVKYWSQKWLREDRVFETPDLLQCDTRNLYPFFCFSYRQIRFSRHINHTRTNLSGWTLWVYSCRNVKSTGANDVQLPFIPDEGKHKCFDAKSIVFCRFSGSNSFQLCFLTLYHSVQLLFPLQGPADCLPDSFPDISPDGEVPWNFPTRQVIYASSFLSLRIHGVNHPTECVRKYHQRFVHIHPWYAT